MVEDRCLRVSSLEPNYKVWAVEIFSLFLNNYLFIAFDKLFDLFFLEISFFLPGQIGQIGKLLRVLVKIMPSFFPAIKDPDTAANSSQ